MRVQPGENSGERRRGFCAAATADSRFSSGIPIATDASRMPSESSLLTAVWPTFTG